MLPIRQAIFLPIFIYTKTEFRSLRGKIEIRGKISPNMIHIGDNTRYVTTSEPLSIWTINGKIIFNGPVKFFYGTYVYVAFDACLTFGTNGTFVGCDTKIICREAIAIGNQVEITWENQIYDTSFHYIKDLEHSEETPKKLADPIVINDKVWIGNRTTIAKGSIIPSNSIIASNSMTNKDYTKYGENCIFAGMPAVCKKQQVQRIFSYDEEAALDKVYNYYRYKL